MKARHHHHRLPLVKPANGWTKGPWAGGGARRNQGGGQGSQEEKAVSGPLPASGDPQNLSGPRWPLGPAHSHQGQLLHHQHQLLHHLVNSDSAGQPHERVSVCEATQAPLEKTPSPQRGFEKKVKLKTNRTDTNQEIERSLILTNNFKLMYLYNIQAKKTIFRNWTEFETKPKSDCQRESHLQLDILCSSILLLLMIAINCRLW